MDQREKKREDEGEVMAAAALIRAIEKEIKLME